MGELEKIKDDVNEIIRSLYVENRGVSIEKLKKYNLENEPINWGDLKCLDVEQKICIYIDELSPDSYNFANFILDELEKKGYDISQFEIVMDW